MDSTVLSVGLFALQAFHAKVYPVNVANTLRDSLMTTEVLFHLDVQVPGPLRPTFPAFSRKPGPQVLTGACCVRYMSLLIVCDIATDWVPVLRNFTS